MAKKKKVRSAGGFNTLTSCISTTMVLIVLGIVAFCLCVAESLRKSTLEEFTVQVLLNDSISDKQTKEMKTFLLQQTPVRQVTFTSKDEAMKQQAEVLGEDPKEFLGYNPYPASFEVYLKADYANRDSLSAYMPAIEKRQYVSEVIYPEDLIDLVNKNIHSFATGLLIVAILLGIVSFSLINNTMRFSAYAKRYTIHTMKLIGAKWSFIRRPFLKQAFWIGFISATCATIVLLICGRMLLSWDAAIGSLFTSRTLFITFSTIYIVGICLTMLCAYFSVNRFLRLRGNKVFLQ